MRPKLSPEERARRAEERREDAKVRAEARSEEAGERWRAPGAEARIDQDDFHDFPWLITLDHVRSFTFCPPPGPLAAGRGGRGGGGVEGWGRGK